MIFILQLKLGTTESVLYILQIPSNSATYSSSLGLNNGTTLFPPTFLFFFIHAVAGFMLPFAGRPAGAKRKKGRRDQVGGPGECVAIGMAQGMS